MAFRHGRFAQVTVNAVDISAFCDSVELTIAGESADTTAFQSQWRTKIAGLIGATAELSGSYDPTATSGPIDALFACITGAVPVTVVHKPGGTAAGQRTNTFSALVLGLVTGSTVDDKVTFSASLEVTGAVTPTTQ